jgi:restriction system protein
MSSLEGLRSLLVEHYPKDTSPQISQHLSQIGKFRFDLKSGDKVITYDPTARCYLVGDITGEYRYDPEMDEYCHVRDVRWLENTIPRDKLHTSTKNTLGAIQTLFEVGEDAKEEIIGYLEGREEAPEDIDSQEAELETIKEDMESSAFEFIKDRIHDLNWEQMQDLVAGILRAMGYKTVVSSKGADRGKDIEASPDGLGLVDTRIRVEVKHRQGQVGSSKIRSFTGGLRPGSRGLYVSTGGFSREALYEADRSEIPLTLIDLDSLTELIILHYDNFDLEARELIPLVKVYWPA